MGWSVLTRPSSISGKAVSSEISFTAMPSRAGSLAVLLWKPVDVHGGKVLGNSRGSFVGNGKDGAFNFRHGARWRSARFKTL